MKNSRFIVTVSFMKTTFGKMYVAKSPAEWRNADCRKEF